MLSVYPHPLSFVHRTYVRFRPEAILMARLRTLKPSFFKNEDLAALPPLTRLLFEGLWCLADREGRLEDRPARIKAEVLPYDKGNADQMLQDLHDSGFIQRYSVDGSKYILVCSFLKHQSPHVKEVPSTIPAPVSAPDEHHALRHEIDHLDEAPDEHGASTGLSDTSTIVSAPSSVFRSPSSVLCLPVGARAEPATPPPRKKRAPVLTDDERARLVQDFGPALGADVVEEAITLALGHASATKYESTYLFVRGWLRRDAARLSGTKSRTNGQKSAVVEDPDVVALRQWSQ